MKFAILLGIASSFLLASADESWKDCFFSSVKCVGKERDKREAHPYAFDQSMPAQNCAGSTCNSNLVYQSRPLCSACTTAACLANCIPAVVQSNKCQDSCISRCNGFQCDDRCQKSCHAGPERIVHVPGPERVVHVPGPERVVHVSVPAGDSSIGRDGSRPNISTVIKLTNIVNNTNIVNVPTSINNTNVNNLNLRTNATSRESQEHWTQNSESRSSRCCRVIQPNVCRRIRADDTAYACTRHQHRTCGDQCTAPVMHAQVRQQCETGEEKCEPQIVYVPQPNPRCSYSQNWPYVYCHQQTAQPRKCDGCYDHYGYGFNNFHTEEAPKCDGCFDEGFSNGSMYRKGPFYRPNYYHIPPCYLTGTCYMQQQMVSTNCGYGGCFGHELIDPAFGVPSYSPYSHLGLYPNLGLDYQSIRSPYYGAHGGFPGYPNIPGYAPVNENYYGYGDEYHQNYGGYEGYPGSFYDDSETIFTNNTDYLINDSYMDPNSILSNYPYAQYYQIYGNSHNAKNVTNAINEPVDTVDQKRRNTLTKK